MQKGGSNMKKITSLAFAVILFQGTAYASEEYVIPSGMSVGIKLYTDGLTVAGVEKLTDKSGQIRSPAAEAGICTGDIIYSANGVGLSTIEQLYEEVNKSRDGVSLEIRRGNENLSIKAKPVVMSDDVSRLGIWVKDSTAGIGTLTYINPESSTYAALGHGILDNDTGSILTVKSGNIQKCTDLTIKKSKRGEPGEIDAVFNGEELGVIGINSIAGVYGKLNDNNQCNRGTPVKTAEINEVHEGRAYIMTDAAGGEVQYYEAEILKLKPESKDTKGMVFKVTDSRLMELSGGIVRGMSGAPIIQDDKLIGAVTHVFVNDPSKGYGIFVWNMLDMEEKLK